MAAVRAAAARHPRFRELRGGKSGGRASPTTVPRLLIPWRGWFRKVLCLPAFLLWCDYPDLTLTFSTRDLSQLLQQQLVIQKSWAFSVPCPLSLPVLYNLKNFQRHKENSWHQKFQIHSAAVPAYLRAMVTTAPRPQVSKQWVLFISQVSSSASHDILVYMP